MLFAVASAASAVRISNLPFLLLLTPMGLNKYGVSKEKLPPVCLSLH